MVASELARCNGLLCSAAKTKTRNGRVPDRWTVATCDLALVEELDMPAGRGLANCDKMSAGWDSREAYRLQRSRVGGKAARSRQ